MAWTPSLTGLGSVNENISISHTITYIDDITMLSYPVTITKDQVNPNTIVVSGGTISGYYQDSFENTITYRTPEDTFPVVTKFEEIDLNKLYQIISYKASTVTSRTFTYTAKAMNGTTILNTQTYSKTVTNDWTAGKNNLQTFVGYT